MEGGLDCSVIRLACGRKTGCDHFGLKNMSSHSPGIMPLPFVALSLYLNVHLRLAVQSSRTVAEIQLQISERLIFDLVKRSFSENRKFRKLSWECDAGWSIPGMLLTKLACTEEDWGRKDLFHFTLPGHIRLSASGKNPLKPEHLRTTRSDTSCFTRSPPTKRHPLLYVTDFFL